MTSDIEMTKSSLMPTLTGSLAEETRYGNWLAMHRDIWGVSFEAITHELYQYVLQPGDHAIDCGVNVGDHTQAMAVCCGKTGKVSAFEAAPVMLDKAKVRLAAFESIEWYDRAVSDRANMQVDFDFYPDATGVSSLRGNHAGAIVNRISVLTTTLDETIHGNVHLIKLDIEGAEYHALLGSERIMLDYRPVIIFENGRQASADRFGYTKDDFFNLFTSRGYHLYSIVGMPLTKENWDEPTVPWQFVAIHPVSPRAMRAYSVMNRAMCRLMSSKDA